MTSTKRLRYAGFILVAAAALLLLFFCSISVRNRYKASPDLYAVLVITENTDVFPVTDYDVLFSKLELPSSYYALDAANSIETQTAGIADAVKATGSEHVILLAYGDAALPVLHASLGQTGTAAVILLAPTLKQSDSMEAFGTASPSARTAVFTFSSAYSSALYERLSGEDTTLFPGLSSGGVLSSTVFISPDASRYIESWNLTGHHSIDRTVLSLLPDAQVRVGEYINNYILPEEARIGSDLNSTAALFQAIKMIASAFLLTGLMLFFASIPKSPRKESLPAGTVSPFVREKDNAAQSVFLRAAKGSLVLSGVSGVLVSAVVLILYANGYPAASVLLFLWPLIFYAIDAFFHLRFFTRTAAISGIPAKRMALSCSLMLFFLLGSAAVRFMYTAGLSRKSGVLPVVYTAGAALFLFLLVWISSVAGNQSKTMNDSRLDAAHFWRKIILFLPFIAMIIIRFATGAFFEAAVSVSIAVMLLLCLWIRRIFRRISGEDWGGAIAFTVLYAIIVII